jgi:hypothetical protein
VRAVQKAGIESPDATERALQFPDFRTFFTRDNLA